MHSNITWACSHIPVLGTVPSAAAASIFTWHPGLHKSPLCTAWGKLTQIICNHRWFWLRLHIGLTFVINFLWHLMFISQFYMPSNTALTKHLAMVILTGAYNIIVLHACSRYVSNSLPFYLTILSATRWTPSYSLKSQGYGWQQLCKADGSCRSCRPLHIPQYVHDFKSWHRHIQKRCAHATGPAWQHWVSSWWWLCWHMAGH